jgi:hypothetical protein
MSVEAMVTAGCRIMNMQCAGSTESLVLFISSSNMWFDTVSKDSSKKCTVRASIGAI